MRGGLSHKVGLISLCETSPVAGCPRAVALRRGRALMVPVPSQPGSGPGCSLMARSLGVEVGGLREFVRVEVAEAIATIRLDRPKMNALNAQVQDEIASAAAEVSADPEIRAVILYGGERVFAAGADIKEMAGLDFQQMAVRSARLQAAFSAVADIPKPVVAA